MYDYLIGDVFKVLAVTNYSTECQDGYRLMNWRLEGGGGWHSMCS